MVRKAKAAKARRHSKPVRVVRAHLKLFAAAAAGFALLPFLPGDWRSSTRLLIAWDFASFIYLVTAVMIVRAFDLKRVQVRADEADEGGAILLVLTVATALASLGANLI